MNDKHHARWRRGVQLALLLLFLLAAARRAPACPTPTGEAPATRAACGALFLSPPHRSPCP